MKYLDKKQAMLGRVAAAAGARELREAAQVAAPTRRQARAGELLACGCLTELEEQALLVAWANDLGIKLLWYDPDKRTGNPARAGWLKKHGRRNGIPDLFVLNRPGLMIEMKAECKRHTLGENQRDVFPRLEGYGWRLGVCHGAVAAAEVLLREGLCDAADVARLARDVQAAYRFAGGDR